MAHAHSHELLHFRGVGADNLPCSGWAMARDVEDLSQRLAADGITLLRARRPWLGSWLTPGFALRLETAAAYHFLEQLASLLGAGMPILDALDLIREDKSSRRHEAVFCAIFESVKSGLDLSDSIAPFLRRSDRIIRRALTLGERSGKFDEVLARLLAQHKKDMRARAQLTRAAVYPMVLMSVSAVVILLMMVWIVPEFNEIYADFGAALPSYTLAVVAFSEFIIANGPAVAAWLAVAGGAFFILHRTSPRLRYALAGAHLRVPLAGHLLRIRLYRQFAADMNLIYRAGMPLGDALSWLSSAGTHPRYRTALERVCEGVGRGRGLSEALADSGFFSRFIVQAVRIGENSGTLEQAFERIEHFHDEALENAADKLIRLFEPLLIAVLSLIIGALVIAMYLPMFNLGFVL